MSQSQQPTFAQPILGAPDNGIPTATPRPPVPPSMAASALDESDDSDLEIQGPAVDNADDVEITAQRPFVPAMGKKIFVFPSSGRNIGITYKSDENGNMSPSIHWEDVRRNLSTDLSTKEAFELLAHLKRSGINKLTVPINSDLDIDSLGRLAAAGEALGVECDIERTKRMHPNRDGKEFEFAKEKALYQLHRGLNPIIQALKGEDPSQAPKNDQSSRFQKAKNTLSSLGKRGLRITGLLAMLLGLEDWDYEIENTAGKVDRMPERYRTELKSAADAYCQGLDNASDLKNADQDDLAAAARYTNQDWLGNSNEYADELARQHGVGNLSEAQLSDEQLQAIAQNAAQHNLNDVFNGNASELADAISLANVNPVKGHPVLGDRNLIRQLLHAVAAYHSAKDGDPAIFSQADQALRSKYTELYKAEVFKTLKANGEKHHRSYASDKTQKANQKFQSWQQAQESKKAYNPTTPKDPKAKKDGTPASDPAPAPTPAPDSKPKPGKP